MFEVRVTVGGKKDGACRGGTMKTKVGIFFGGYNSAYLRRFVFSVLHHVASNE